MRLNVINTRRPRLPGALWVALAAALAALVLVLAQGWRGDLAVHTAYHAGRLDGLDAGRAEMAATVADAWRAGLQEGVDQATACQHEAPAPLRTGCCRGQP